VLWARMHAKPWPTEAGKVRSAGADVFACAAPQLDIDRQVFEARHQPDGRPLAPYIQIYRPASQKPSL